MTTAPATSYDEVPYQSKPLFSTHPDCLGAAARLRGIAAAAPGRCRVLELGCAGGGNLLPMAYSLPSSEFVGIDLSPRQIAQGQEAIDAIGLKNITLRAASIADVDASFGKFDYILCHGVFSWVPAPIREKIWWIIKHLLTENGISYISYNTYPGWHLKSVARDLMKYHAARFDDPTTKVAQARSILKFMAGASEGDDRLVTRVLAEEAATLPEAADYYLYHEHLEDANQPLYFHEFVKQARAVGLDYLGEAWHHTQIDSLPAEVRETLDAISADLIDLEQFVDFFRNRTFRRTLVCHASNRINRTPDPAVLEPMFLETLVRPQSSTVDVASDKEEVFVFNDNTTARTNHPVFKAALLEMFERWPASIAFPDLLSAVVRRLKLPADDNAAAQQTLASLLLRGYLANVVAIHCEPFRFVTQVSDRPTASALARWTARRQSHVPTLRHRLTSLNPAERSLLGLIDGQRTIAEICGAAEEAVVPLLAPEQRATATPEWVQVNVRQSLKDFARVALLEA